MNKLLLLLPLFLLSACDDSTAVATVKPYGFIQRGLDQTPGLSDCKAYKVDGDKVIRCPNSTTTVDTKHSSGKSSVIYRTVTIDGEQYELVKK